MIADEYGVEWLVETHAPAAKLKRELESRGYGLIILPRKVLAGTLDVQDAEVPPPPVLPFSSAEEFIWTTRLRECMEVLCNT